MKTYYLLQETHSETNGTHVHTLGAFETITGAKIYARGYGHGVNDVFKVRVDLLTKRFAKGIKTEGYLLKQRPIGWEQVLIDYRK